MAENKADVLFIELCDRRKSGFVMQGTENTALHTELDVPNYCWIPSSGFMSRKVTETVNGKKVEVTRNIEIRWVKNCDEIEVSKQNSMGIKPNPKEDKIILEKGYATVVREGSTASLYDFLYHVFYNEDAPNRPAAATKIYRLLKLDQKAEDYFEDKDIYIKASQHVMDLMVKKGDKYQYNEDRITTLCALFQVYAETWSTKVRALMAHAETYPKFFLDQVTKFDQVIETEVLHALDLQVIKFDGNIAQYLNEDKVIKNLGTGNLSHQDKIQKLGDYLKTRDASSDLTELRSKIEMAKQKL